MAKGRRKNKSEEIKDLRTRNYRQIPESIIKSEKDSVDFINKMGICLLFPSDKIELPNMLQSVYGMPHPMINDAHWDKETLWTWNLKDTLPQKGLAFYGKFIQEKGTFLSPNFLTYFYSMLNLSIKHDNYKSLYQNGEITQNAKNIADLLLEKGSLSAKELRSALKMTSRKGGVAFQQAITNLQSNLIITNFGTEKISERLSSTKYELITRVFYDEVERSQQISSEEARKLILHKYINVVVQTNTKEVSKLFGWNIKIVESIFKELISNGDIGIITLNDEESYYATKYVSLAS